MSFVCRIGNHQSQPGERSVRIAVETREKEYPARENAHRFPHSLKTETDFDGTPKEPNEWKVGKKKRNAMHDPGGKGFEIVREVLACPSCAASLTQSA